MSKRRLAASRRVYALMKDKNFRSALPMHPSGERVVLIAAPNERMRSLSTRMARAGFPLSLFMWGAGGRLRHAIFEEVPHDDRHHAADDVIDVNPNITIKFVMDVVGTKGCAILHIAGKDEPADYRAERGGEHAQELEDALR